MSDLTLAETHFRFGDNWAEYSRLIDEDRRAEAMKSVHVLVGDLDGKTFLDIGSGSGLFSAAALELGASRVAAVDIDADSVATTRKVLAGFKGDWTVQRRSVFDLPGDTFDVVYSWGVLHHTGDMWRAIAKAASLASDTFAFALYEKTPLCPVWRAEKRFYSRSGRIVQSVIRGGYKAAFRTAYAVSGKGLAKRDMKRGMDFDHDVHDWLGGYPYESTTLSEVDPFMSGLGFKLVSHKPATVHAKGLFGTGCSEFVYER